MKIKLNNVRLAFPRIWTPEPFPNGNDPTPYFSAIFIVPPSHPQFAELLKARDAVAAEKWPKNWQQVVKLADAKGKVFFRDGDVHKAGVDGFEGNWFVSSRSKLRPTIVDRNRTPLTEADGRPYGGCFVNGIFEVFAYDNAEKGVAAQLQGVQFAGDGDSFGGGRAAAADEFEELAAAATDLV